MSGSTVGSLPDEAFAVALASIPGMGWRRTGILLHERSARDAWDAVCAGAVLQLDRPAENDPVSTRLAGAVLNWQARAQRFDVAAAWRRTRALGIEVLVRGRPGYPLLLADDPEPPPVVFVQGRYPMPDQPRVAIVGTRHCSHEGREVARALGYGLAESGVVVVSGLALGIDGAAHQGVLAAFDDEVPAAAPFGLVASGLDMPYPQRHTGLWRQVAARGGLLSEYPPGAAATRIRFPARNRLIAAFADVVVVVESRAAGGSRHTVDAAIDRGRTVLAVPGSIRNPAAAGTNLLIAEGCAPVCDLGDVLTALDLARAGTPLAPGPLGGDSRHLPPSSTGGSHSAARATRGGRRAGRDPAGDGVRPPMNGAPPGLDDAVAGALSGTPASLDALLLRTGLSLLELSGALERLRACGRAAHDGGWWSRR